MTLAHHRPAGLADALDRLGDPSRMPIGGGADLLEAIAEGLAAPSEVVEVAGLAELLGVTELPDGGVRIGGGVRLAEIAAHPLLREHYAVLASACEQAGTAAVRAVATLGGNLCQRPRCPYLRRRVPCRKNGGTTCPAAAVDGENELLAIVEGGPCFIVQLSDPAVALLALDAVIELAGPSGRRELPAADFFVLPSERLDRETALAPGELVTGVRLPTESGGGTQRYSKRVQRGTWEFAFVSLAAVRRADGEVRLVLGGVSPRPYRVYNSVEEEVMTGGLDEDTIAGLAERAMLDAVPLSRNGYKLPLAESLLRDAIAALASD